MTENKEPDNRQIKIGDGSNYNESIERDYIQGNACYIYNYNYYYREDVRVTPVKPADASGEDDSLPCPYRGLFHFGPNDAEFFFGREVFVEKLVKATETHNFITVLGPSGSGKSSVVLAGMVPELQQKGNWKFTHFRPGSDPFYSLAEALVPLYRSDLDSTDKITQAGKLAQSLKEGQPITHVFTSIQRNHPNYQVLLIADQFEEIYTHTISKEQTIDKRFLNCLLTIIQSPTNQSTIPVVLVVTMRADFLGNALLYRQFADVLQSADIKLGAMNREELKQIIERPALKQGITFQDGLVGRILTDVEDEPGNLPLLEFALTLLWKRRTDRQLTHAAYEAIGEVQGSLAIHADKTYDNLNAAEQQQVQRIFIQLVHPGEGREDTRRLATKAELGEISWSLVKQLADARLVVTNRSAANQETVEIVHEALIRNWGKLRQWMENDRRFRLWQERLRAEMRQWETTDRDEEALLRGVPLAEAKGWLQQRYKMLSPTEQKFIQLSLRGQRNRKIWSRILIGAVSGAILFAAGLSLWGMSQEKISKSLQLANASKTNLKIDTTRSLWLAIVAKLTQDTPQADLALLNALQENHERFQLVGHKGKVTYAEFDPRNS